MDNIDLLKSKHNNCPDCGNETKIILGSYLVKTRIPGKRSFHLENVKFVQCRVCDYRVICDEEVSTVRSVRQHYTNKYLEEQKALIEERRSRPIYSFFKGIIG